MSTLKFKVGDEVRVVGSHDVDGGLWREGNKHIGSIYLVTEVDEEARLPYTLSIPHDQGWLESDLSLVKRKENTFMGSTIEKLRSLALGYDEKLFRKWGITDSESNLTEEGKELLLDILFADNRSTVLAKVEELEAEEKASKKK